MRIANPFDKFTIAPAADAHLLPVQLAPGPSPIEHPPSKRPYNLLTYQYKTPRRCTRPSLAGQQCGGGAAPSTAVSSTSRDKTATAFCSGTVKARNICPREPVPMRATKCSWVALVAAAPDVDAPDVDDDGPPVTWGSPSPPDGSRDARIRSNQERANGRERCEQTRLSLSSRSRARWQGKRELRGWSGKRGDLEKVEHQRSRGCLQPLRNRPGIVPGNGRRREKRVE